MAAQDLATMIGTLAGNPIMGMSDGQQFQMRPMADLIKADQYLALKAAMALGSRGIRFNKIIPAGPMDDQHCNLGGSGW